MTTVQLAVTSLPKLTHHELGRKKKASCGHQEVRFTAQEAPPGIFRTTSQLSASRRDDKSARVKT